MRVGAKGAGSHGAPPALVALAAVALVALTAGAGVRQGAARQDEATATARSPYAQVIAQGLAFFEEDVPYVWRVREIAPPLEEEAGPAEAIAFSFLWQRAGVTIIRNEETIRRARLEPGEAYYMSAGLTFARYRVGDSPSRAWIIEIVPADSDASDLDGEVIYTSQEMNSVPAGTWDLELVRNVLLPGEEADMPPHTGPALLLPTFGELETVNEGGSVSGLGVGDGRVTVSPQVLRNSSDAPVTYLVAVIGDRVLDPGETPEAVETEEVPEGSPVATPLPGPRDDNDQDGLTNEQEEELGTDPNNPDTDGDGLTDGEEVEDYDCDPLLVDTDGDDLDDGDEIAFETDCRLIDSDGDGYVDGEEVFLYDTDPNDQASNPSGQ
jgi:hypothetical protein